MLTLTEPWAILSSGILTLFAAIIIAIIGPLLLGKKFETLDDAARQATKAVKKVQETTDQVQERMRILDVQIGALERSVAAVQNELIDFAEDREVAEISAQPVAVVGEEARRTDEMRDELRGLWNDIRASVEDIASDPQTDGRTRAKYSRIDRRNYRRLLEALSADQPQRGDWQPFFQAYEIWSRYRANRAEVVNSDIEEMRNLKERIVGEQNGY